MQIRLETDVQKAVEALTGAGIPASKLIAVSARVAELAPHLWGNCPQEEVRALAITSSPLSDAT